MRHAICAAVLLLSLAIANQLHAEDTPTLPPDKASLKPGVELTEFKWQTLATHQVNASGVTGTIQLQAFVPENLKVEGNSIPMAYGFQTQLLFELRPEDKGKVRAPFTFNLTVPDGANDWLQPFAESDLFGNLKQKVSGNNHAASADIDLSSGWWAVFPVTPESKEGEYKYAVTVNGLPAAAGSFFFAKVSREERDRLQRMATIYFFAHEAWPHMYEWVSDNEGRLPTTKEFLKELKNLAYFPANDYTAHRGLPKLYSSIKDPGTTWLARECRPAMDGKIVICYSDGSIAIETAPDEYEHE